MIIQSLLSSTLYELNLFAWRLYLKIALTERKGKGCQKVDKLIIQF